MEKAPKAKGRVLHIRIPQFKTLNMIAIVVMVCLFVSGVLIIRNINKEYAIRQIAGKFQEFKYATLSFNNVYSGLPGDITNATFYWKDLTTDGNGNRRIEHELGEGIASFKQLQMAELVTLPQDITGKWTDKGQGILVPGVNIPQVHDENTGIYFSFSEALLMNVYTLGEAEEKDVPLEKPALTPDDAYMLDLMIDDGYPSKGSVIGATTISSGCFVAGEYKKEKERKECLVFFKL